jgi:excinuclease UvrABC nuclease subunit
MIADILHEKPKDMVDYMLQQLEAKFGERARNGDVSEIARLQSKIQVLQAKVEKQRENKPLSEKDSAAGSEDETDSDVSEFMLRNKTNLIGRRRLRW